MRRPILLHAAQRGLALGLLSASLAAMLLTGCSLPHWARLQPASVLDPGCSKEELIAHLNRHVAGTATRPGVTGWKADNAGVKLSGIPGELPSMIAVEAPRNLRLTVSMPISGSLMADIGSNSEKFWIWTNESQQVLTSRHDDVALALDELQMPVHIHPDWLLEVFGVTPIDPDEFRMVHPPSGRGPEVELVADRQSPLGADIERVIRVNVPQGRITQHILRLPGGKIVARAALSDYRKSRGGVEMPHSFVLHWPDAHVSMAVNIRDPEMNPDAFQSNLALWRTPQFPGSQVVDIGQLARSRQRRTAVPDMPELHSRAAAAAPAGEKVARVEHIEAPEPAAGVFHLDAASPASSSADAFGHAPRRPPPDVPEWALRPPSGAQR